jgi:hypothetical protein
MKFLRLLYLNIYAFLLLALGLGIFLLPMEIFLVIFKIILSLWSVAGAAGIASQSKGKLRLIPILYARNKNGLRPDTFKAHTKTLCGTLMVYAVLRDLRKSEAYRDLPAADWKECKRKALGGTAKKHKRKRTPSAS